MAAKKAQTVSDEVLLQSYIDSVKNILDTQVQTLMPLISGLRIQKQIKYALQTRGKNLRGALVLLSGESVGGASEKLQKLAIAMELLHSASLVHDDILDREVFRRNALSVQARFSVKEAILVGDALASLALGLGRDYSSEILDVMASTCLQLSDGEYMDVEFGRSSLSEGDYFEKVRKKTGALFEAAARCGALASNGTNKEVEALSNFGMNFGIAFQIRDDCSDVLNIQNNNDFSELKGTLPIIHLVQTSKEDAEKLFLKLSLPNNEIPQKKVAMTELLSMLDKNSCFQYCDTKIQRCVANAISGLEFLRESSYRFYLCQMAQQLRVN